MKVYIETCKDWLLALSEDDEEEEEDIPTQVIPFSKRVVYSDNIGLLREQVFENNMFSCFICKTENVVAQGRIVVANPFTISQCMLLCKSCDN